MDDVAVLPAAVSGALFDHTPRTLEGRDVAAAHKWSNGDPMAGESCSAKRTGPDERGEWAACRLVLAGPGLSELTAGFLDCLVRDVDWMGLAAEALSWEERERYLLTAAYAMVTGERHTLAELVNEQLGAPGDPGQRLAPGRCGRRCITDSDRRRLDLAHAVRLGELSLADAVSQLDP